LQDHHFYRCYFNGPHLYPADRPDNGAVYIPSNSQTGEQWEFHAPGRRLLSLDDGTAWQPVATVAYQLMVRSFCATSKRDENRVEVKEGPPGSAVIHFEYDAADLAARARMQENGARIGTALGLELVEGRFLPMGNSYHEAGGLDMGSDPETSVTNAHGAFHDLTRVVVADAASWPCIGATNPHLTTLAIARRQSSALADRLLADT
jgi:choline dehydrogenase-like flavoprotein